MVNCSLLNKLLLYMDNIFYLNDGGCCYIAYVIARNCEKYKIPYKVVFCDEEDIFPEDIVSKIKKRSKKGIFTDQEYSCCHINIKIKNININPMDWDFEYETNDINSKDLLWIYRKGDWNKCYETSNNSLISKFLNKVCEKTLN